jgi:deoxycytidine triphosphate deaminase
MPPPTDDELAAMTGVTPQSTVAGMDRDTYQAWRDVGFSHEEAVRLLIAHKQGTVYLSGDIRIILKKEE